MSPGDRFVHNAGLTVPGDVAVVGYGNQPFTPFALPPLTTLAPPDQQIGKEAIRVLCAAIENKQKGILLASEDVHLVPELIIRSSSIKSQGDIK